MKTQVEKTKLLHQNVNHQIFIMALRRKGFSDVISWPHSCWRLCGDSLYYLMHNGVNVFLKLHSISFTFSILWDTYFQSSSLEDLTCNRRYFKSWNVTLKRLWPHFGSLFSQWENTNQPNNCLASLRLRSYFFLKFIFSKMATKIDEILTMYLPFTT